jgi:TetR/AcrR family transcriptional regulator, lmrAB and yxaGH operons repressor
MAAAAVLRDTDVWFAEHVIAPLRDTNDPRLGLSQMFQALDTYFQGGDRICLTGFFALGATRDRFESVIRSHFAVWSEALADALRRTGFEPPPAAAFAEEILINSEGALILARALGDPLPFLRTLARLKARANGSD